MADVSRGATSAGYEDAIARAKAQENSIRDLEAKEKKLAETQAANDRARGSNVGVRKQATDAISQQVKAIEASQRVLAGETEALLANTRAWQANIAERLGGGRGVTTAGYAEAIAATQAQSASIADLDAKTARLGATQAEASRRAAAGAVPIAQFGTGRGEAEITRAAEVEAASTRLAYQRALASLPSNPALADEILRAKLPTARTEFPSASVAEAPQPRTFVAGPATPAGYQQVVEEGGQRRVVQAAPVEAATQRTTAYLDPRTGQVTEQAANIGQLTEQEKSFAAQQERAAGILGTFPAKQAQAAAGWRLMQAETAAASQAITRHGALTSDFIQLLVRGEATLGEFGSQLTLTIGKFAGWAVAGGLVYGAFEALKRVVEGAKETRTGVQTIERAGLPNFNRAKAEEGLLEGSQRLNVPIKDIAEAQFYATRAGFRGQSGEGQRESLRVGETAILAQKLDLVPVQDATKAFGALRAAYGLNAEGISQVFNILDVGQREFNARIQQTLPYMGRAAAAFHTAGGSVTALAQQIIEVTGAVGGGGGTGGGSAATFFTREPGNLRRPSSDAILREFGFDPHEAIDALNRSIQAAARTGVAPSGAAFDQQGRSRVAEALGGGPAIGGRFALQLIESGRTGRAREVEEQANPQAARGAVAYELGKKLGQVDEQFAAIGHTFDRLGGELGRSGIIRVAEDLLSIMRKLGQGFEVVLGPAENLAQLAQGLPTVLQQALVVGGIGAGASRLQERRAIGRQEAEGTYLDERGLNDRTPKDALKYINRTLDEERRAATTESEAAARETRRARVGEQNAVAQQKRINERYGPELAPIGPTGERIATTDAQRVAANQIASAEAGTQAAAARVLVVKEQQLATYVRQRAVEEEIARVNDPKLSREARVAGFVGRGGVAAQPGVGNLKPVLGGTGPLGTAYEARGGREENAPPAEGGSPNPFVRAEQQARAQEAEAVQRQATQQAEMTVALAQGTRGVVEGGKGLSLALKEDAAQAKEGGAQLAAGLADAAAALVAPGVLGAAGGIAGGLRTARGGLGGILGAAGGAASDVFGALGQNALKGFFAAYLGSAIAEILGGAVGGKAGSTIEGIGGYAAVGAGIGTVIPYIGTGVGALGGAAYGLGKELAGSGDRPPTAEAIKAREKKRVEQQEVVEQQEEDVLVGFSKARPGTAGHAFRETQRKLLAGQGRLPSNYGENLPYIADEAGVLLEEAFKDEGESAQKAKAAFQKHLKDIGATLKLFGSESPQGRGAIENLQGSIEALVHKIFKEPKNPAEELATLEQGTDVQASQGKTDLGLALKSATTPQQRQGALQTYKNRIYTLYEGFHHAGVKLDQEREKVERDQAEKENQLAASTAPKAFSPGHGKGLSPGSGGGPTPADIRKAIDEDAKKVANFLASKRAFDAGAAQYYRLLNELKEAPTEEVLGAAEKQIDTHTKLSVLRAGGDKKGVRKAEEQGARELADETKALTKNAPRVKESGELKALESHNQTVVKGLEDLEAEGRVALAGIPRTNKAGRAQQAATNAQAVANYIKQNAKSGAFDWKKIEDAIAASTEAQEAVGENFADETREMIEARGRLAKARAYGSAQAEAAVDIGVAEELIGAAKTPSQRVAAEAQRQEAVNAAQRASQEKVRAETRLAESKATSPLQKEKIKIRGDEKLLRNATPDERLSIHAELNDEKRKFIEDQATEAEDETKFLLHVHAITNDQAVARLQKTLRQLKARHAEPQKIRSLESEIYDLQNENQQDFDVGNIRQPTLYGARSLRGLISGGQNVSFSQTAAVHPPPVHLEANITIVSPDGHKKSVHKLHRVAHTINRAHGRSAGQR